MKGKFMVVDGNSLVHRAFHALPLLFSNRQGVHTNAAYGFTTMLWKALELEKPTHAAVAFDKGRVTFRLEQFRGYKGHRKETPEELRPQFQLVKRILAAMDIPIFEIEGYEADDLIGTLVRQAEAAGLESVILTGDRDSLQLVSDRTRALLTKKGITQLAVYDREALRRELGLEPWQVVDLKSLTGDPSDNIPGVPGIGEKTALRLLKEYGSLEDILANVEQLSSPALRSKLADYADQARMSKDLATIVCDVPLEVDWEACRRGSPRYPELLTVLQELEFRSLAKTVLEAMNKERREQQKQVTAGDQLPGEGVPAGAAPRTWAQLGSLEDLANYLKCFGEAGRGALTLVFDGEDYLAAPVLAVGLACPGAQPAAFSLVNDEPWEVLAGFLEGTRAAIYGHNAKAALVALGRRGLPRWRPAGDTMVMAYLCNPGLAGYSLRELAQSELNRTFLPEAPSEEAALGAATVLELGDLLEQKLRLLELDNLYREVELPLIGVLADMELTGVKVDRRQLEELGQELTAGMEAVAAEIFGLAGEEFNLNSPRQLGVILFEKLQLPRRKKTKTGYSTSAEVLEELALQHPIAARILEYRQLMKLKSTYVDGLKRLIDPKSGKVHTTLHQTSTATGRLSSAEPNLQNIPVRLELGRRLRKAFGPSSPDNVILAADYSQIELRILAHISKDERLLAAFHGGEDIHTLTAAEVFGVARGEVTSEMRRRAKAVNFGIVYGISDFGLSRDLGISRPEAHEYITRYFERYQGVKRYIDEVIARAREDGYVTTLLKRRRYLPDILSRDYAARNWGERTAMNTPIQGSAADIIKLAMVRIHRALEEKGLKTRMILQVHDELIFDTPLDELAVVADLVKEHMENVVELRVPLEVDLKSGPNWYDLKPWPPV